MSKRFQLTMFWSPCLPTCALSADDCGRMGSVQSIADTKTEKIAGRPCRARASTPDGAGTMHARCAAQEVNEQ